MNAAGLVYLLVAHYLCGRGVLRMFRVELPPLAVTCLAFMIGVPVVSFAPCFMQLLHIPIATLPLLASITILTGLMSVPLLRNLKRPRLPRLTLPRVYEWPFLIVIGLLAVVSVWRCYYLPPYARDMLTGPELLAEYAVREQTMISSVFTIDLQTSNNHFKSPFITSLQIIYKLLVCPFGQVWLSLLFLSFTIWLYSLVRERIHPIIAGLLMLLFMAIPELYCYTYVLLFDYSNMIFFFGGFYFLARFIPGNDVKDVVFSMFLFGLATYIRAETVVLVALLLPLLLWHLHRREYGIGRSVRWLAAFIVVPMVSYSLSIHVFVRSFVPLPFDVGSHVNQNLGDVSVFFRLLRDTAKVLIFSQWGLGLYGYFIWFFHAVLLVDLVWLKRMKGEARIYLYGIAVVTVGLALVGYLVPLGDLENTTKRGLFKALPLMLLYLANSHVLHRVGDGVQRIEVAARPDRGLPR